MQGNIVVRLLSIAVAAAAIAYIVHLRSETSHVAAAPAVTAAASPTAAVKAAAQPAPAVPPRTLDAAQRQALIEKLGGPNSSLANPVWFATVPNNPEAAAFQKDLQSAFEEAGWSVKGNAAVRFPMKAGVFVFAADEDPPNYVATAQEGLEAGGVTVVSSGRGYREFYNAKKQENSSWVGLEMAPDQSYVIVIGRRPPADQPTPEATTP